MVVDFSPWGGNIERGCAATLSTGYNAMISAGFTPAGDELDGPAFICRIDDEPPPSEEACVDTPPVSASWSYWHADVGQNVWTYSSDGATSYEPPPGSVDAWTFGGSSPNVQPQFSPSSVRANNPGPPATTTTGPTTTEGTTSTSPRTTYPPAPTRTSTTTSSGKTPTSTASTTATSEARGAGGTKPSSTSSPPPSSSTKSGDATPGRRPGPKIVSVSASPATADPSGGSGVPFLIGAVAIVCLVGAGGFAAWRRRRTEAR